MDGASSTPFEFSQESIDRLKEKYSTEMKDDANNPIKICMKLVFEAAIEKDHNKRVAISLELSKFLTRSDGVINLFLALVDFDTSSQKVTTHNQRFLAVAKVITLLPKLCIPFHDYCDNISRQLRPLIIHPKILYSSLAAIIMKALIESPHAKSRDKTGPSAADIVVGPILKPLTTDADKFKISHAILAIHNLIQNHMPSSLFVGHFSELFYCLVTLKDTPSQLKGYLRSTLVEIIANLQPGPACCLLEKTILHDCGTCNTYEVVMDDDDEITVGFAENPTEPDPAIVDELVIELLETCDNNPLVVEYFFHFQSRIWTTCDRDTLQRCVSLIEPLVIKTIEEKPDDQKLDVLASIMNDSKKARGLIDRTLMHYLDFLRLNRDEQSAREAQNLAEVSIGSCLNILQVLYATTDDPGDLESIQARTVPTLREMKRLLYEMSGEEETADKKLVQSIDTLLEELTKDGRSRSGQRLDENLLSQREHQVILKDLNDKLVPVRVHALVRLRQMLMANDKHTIDMIPQLYPMVEGSLADQEPYVFLASINLLAEMSIRRTSDILPKLLALHARPDLDIQQRINVGEALVKLTRQMNTTTPHYAGQIINALLRGTTDAHELIRMSSLTNLGSLCGNLGNSLGKYILDILASIQCILESDTIQAKCAAVDLLRTALAGIDRHNVESVQRDLKSIYALLKKLAQTTLDEKLCLQVDLALDEVKRLAKDIMGFSKDGSQIERRLVKNIRVLSLD